MTCLSSLSSPCWFTMFKGFGSCEMLPFPPLLPHLLSLLPSLAFKNQTRPELYNLKINNERKKQPKKPEQQAKLHFKAGNK